MKIASIVGARPQFVKAAAVSRALSVLPEIEHVLIHTGQHYDSNMSEIFFDEFQLRPDYNLGVGSGLPGAQTARMLESIERVLRDVRPQWVIVYGDTNSTLAGALAAAKARCPLAHVEAGLRCFDLQMPEELNRVVTDHISQLLFAPTILSVHNLVAEGLPVAKIHLVGDVMYDVFLHSTCVRQKELEVLSRLHLRAQGYVLATIHRAENTDDIERLRIIIKALTSLARDLPVVLPVHPRTRQALKALDVIHTTPANFQFIDPVPYREMLQLAEYARVIATDSGGLQKEAFFLRVPCVILRGRTEWQELVDLGWSLLVEPLNSEDVADAIRNRLRCTPHPCPSPYGDGHSAERVAEVLLGRSSQIGPVVENGEILSNVS